MTDSMQFADTDAGAVPITVLAESELADWLDKQPPQVSAWVKAAGFKGRGGETVFVLGEGGKPQRIFAGRGAETADIWRIAGLATALPEGTYRLESGADPQNAALG